VGLSAPGALIYSPAPLGLLDARAAIAADYTRRGLRIGADRIVLTASTSEAYSILFKLLCEPGHSNVLTPVPSYPLFDHLTRLDGVVQKRYPLEFHGAWTVDLEALDRAWTPETRAVLAVSPNNPTGSVVGAADADELTSRCAARGAALILDEVFADYPLSRPFSEPAAFAAPACLLCRLGGLSKSIGLPQVKLGWIALEGPDDLVAEAIDRLELVNDTYLSVSTPVQLAARSLLDGGGDRAHPDPRSAARQRHGAARDCGRLEWRHGPPRRRRMVRGGPRAGHAIEEALVTELVERDAVAVHPGYFFDFAHEAFLVVSLLPEPGVFARGAQMVQDRIDAA